MGFIGLLKNLFGAISKILGGLQRSEDKKSGAKEVELEQMKAGDNARKQAKKVRKDSPKRTKREHLDRL